MTRKRLLELLDDAKAALNISGLLNREDRLAIVPLLVALVQKDKPGDYEDGYQAGLHQVPPEERSHKVTERARKLGPAPLPMQPWTADPTKGRTPTDGGQP